MVWGGLKWFRGPTWQEWVHATPGCRADVLMLMVGRRLCDGKTGELNPTRAPILPPLHPPVWGGGVNKTPSSTLSLCPHDHFEQIFNPLTFHHLPDMKENEPIPGMPATAAINAFLSQILLSRRKLDGAAFCFEDIYLKSGWKGGG